MTYTHEKDFRYRGWQDDGRGGTLLQLDDLMSGSTVSVGHDETISQAIERSRAKFEKPVAAEGAE